MPRKSKRTMICSNAGAASVKKRRDSSSRIASNSPSVSTSQSIASTSQAPIAPLNIESDSSTIPLTASATLVSTTPAVSTTSQQDSSTENSSDENSSDEEDIRTNTEILDDFCDEWLVELDNDDRRSLAVLLCNILTKEMGFQLTPAAQLAAKIVGKSDRTVRQWRTKVIRNNGKLKRTKQGRYWRKGVLWRNEELSKMAKRYVQNNSSVKGKPNMTTYDFCHWVNSSLLPNLTLEPGFPRKVVVSTCLRWLKEMGFEVLTPRKGIFFDGHERPDVVESRTFFLRRMVKLGFLNLLNAPTDDSRKAILLDIEPPKPPTAEKRDKTVFLFHDESIFHANDDQNHKWGMKGEKIMNKKGKGAGIMVSDFVDEKNGFLALNDDEYERAKEKNPNIKMYSLEFLEYGKNKEGYWTMKRFMAQIHLAVEIAELKYPKEDGWRLCWIFDNSRCHNAMADNALNVRNMNVKSGGAQRILRDTMYNGKTQKMYFMQGGVKTAKGLKMVLQECGISTEGKSKDWMQETLSQHLDFKFEKSEIEKFILKKGHIPTFLPKFHPELNPIERVWAQLKRYTQRSL